MNHLSDTSNTATEALFANGPQDEALLAHLFGDDESDPGPLFDRFAQDQAAKAWLRDFIRDYPRLTGKAESPAVSRAEALLAELEHRAQHPIDWGLAREANVVSLAAARTHKQGRLGPRLAIFGVLAATLAAAAFIAVSVGKTAREVDIGMAQALVGPILDQAGHGFAGAPIPSPRERGFLLGAVIDLSRPRKATGQVGETELALARDLADRALEGLADAPDATEDRRQRLLGGCAAILTDPAERKDCEDGLADYQRRRDAY
jgi:hypothetical protein